VKQLRQAVQEIDDLRNEEEEKRFAEVTQNGDHRKSHSTEKKKIWMN